MLTSDSLNATVIVSDLVLTISTNGELELPDEDDEPEVVEPRFPAEVPEEPVEEEPDEAEVPLDPLEVLDPEALPVVPADTVSPGERLASEATVPLIGAYSLV